MLFASLVFISAFLIESIGSYISIVGLSALFSTNPVIITLALSLDIAKVVTVSFLYKQWSNISKFMKYYMTAAAVILMVITSSGAAGYLSAEFQKAILPTKGTEIMVKSMTDEKSRLEARKLEIDKQIAQLPSENVRGRQRLQRQFAGELDHLNSRIIEIDQELPKLQMEQVDINAHTGPILYIAEAFDTTVESAVKYVILLIIFVFDPLAVALIIAGNFLLDQRKKEQDEISKKLDDIKREVDHIEEELNTQAEAREHQETEIVIDDKDVNTEDISIIPSDNEIPIESVNFHKPLFTQFPLDVLDEDVEESTEEVLLPKRKRGRKKKDEAEPKPAITTEEQLATIVEIPVESCIEHNEPSLDQICKSDLSQVNHLYADVEFNKDSADDGDWKPSKKVMNVYTATE